MDQYNLNPIEDHFPKITVVTPSYNQGKYLEKTINSIIRQDYPNMEYLIMDGGSNDSSLEIIKKYEQYINFWISSSDEGQVDAINKGFEMSSGEIICWLNSDDLFIEGALKKVGTVFKENPNIEWIIGDGYFIDQNDQILGKCECPPIDYKWSLYAGMNFLQQSMFFKKSLFKKVQGFDQNLDFSFDYDLALKFLSLSKPYILHEPLAFFRLHQMSKTSRLKDVNQLEDKLVRQKQGVLNYNISYYVVRYYYLIKLLIFRMASSGIKQYFIFKFGQMIK